ncbi:PRC-barrel domain-containing protein [uncultured Methanobrevibacter sp.]|uniref:PRC-barrel domain-containing protein n=1 Tax=uncultured Methanobrevibacter sp. TaxID=253161 RepID=UPI002609217E
MVEVSSLYDLDIYTLAGQYVGQVHDVVLNIRYGTISRLQVKAIEPERRSAGIRDIFRGGFQFVPEEETGRSYQEGLLNIEFDRVTAIGDIMLIDPQDLKRPKPPVVGEEMSIRPKVEAPKAEAPKVEAPKIKE